MRLKCLLIVSWCLIDRHLLIFDADVYSALKIVPCNPFLSRDPSL